MAILPTNGSAKIVKYFILGKKIKYIHIGQRIEYLPGLQSVSREHIDSKTLDIVKAGDQLSLRISRHITPWLLILQ